MSKKVIMVILAVVLVTGVWDFYRQKADRTTDVVEIEKKKKTIKEETDFYTIEAEYPEEERDKEGVMKEFVEYLIRQKKEEWKTGGEVYNTEKETAKDYPERPVMTYSLNIIYEKSESKKMGTVSYLFRMGEYTGGANAKEKIQTFNFDQEGKLEIESFLDIAGYEEINGKKVPSDIILSEKILEETKNDPEKFPDTEMVKQGLGLSYLKADGVTLDHQKCNCDGFFYGSNLQNFTVTDKGLVFYFSKGEITIGAAGSVGVELTWEDLGIN